MHVMDMALVGKVTPLRKGLAFGLQLPRAFIRRMAGSDAYRATPPIIVNSIPKSGTHLLMQVARALPDARYFGSFLAQQPSLSLRQRSQHEINRGLGRLVPGEVLGTHLHYTAQTAASMRRMNSVHFMIVRDPLDVLLSEAHYLRSMARFHRMHREFQTLSAEDAIARALSGSVENPEIFPEFAQRILPYCGWAADSDCCIIRFEDMREQAKSGEVVGRIIAYWAERTGYPQDQLPALNRLALNAIQPEKSHTFSNRKRIDDTLRRKLAADEQIRHLRAQLGYGQEG